MIISRSVTSPIDERYWTGRPLNLDLATARTGTHDKYQIELMMNDVRSSGRTFSRASDVLFRYDIFPPQRMLAHVCTPDGRVSLGATIIQRVLIGPVVIEMAVRVVEVVDGKGDDRIGFTYATLDGHVERGVATFSIHRRPDNTIVFEIETWSRPGHVLAHLGRPFARFAQRTFTREALSHFRDAATSQR